MWDHLSSMLKILKVICLYIQIIQAHSEMQVYVGIDVDPIAHKKAQSQLKSITDRDSFDTASALKVHTFLKNFKDVKSVLGEVANDLLTGGVNGILMDLGMSSMQVCTRITS